MSFSREFDVIKVEAVEYHIEFALRCKKCLNLFKIKVKVFTEQEKAICPNCGKAEVLTFSQVPNLDKPEPTKKWQSPTDF